jgi:ectoine hydroxylase-related dioxygenase (phytanoyl-CoA dioxygenase family)
MLTEEQIAHFYREGYVVVPSLVPTSEIDCVLDAVPADMETSGNWQPRIFDHSHPEQEAGLHRLLTEPHILEAVEEIFEAPARVYYGMLAVVPAHGGKGLPWHQDNQYDQIVGSALNTFVALCDITPDKAILWVAPRTHLLGTQPAKEAEGMGGHREAVTEPENGMQLPTLYKGDVCIFDRNTYHRSLKNDTGEDRYAYAAQYQADAARRADTGAKDPSKMRAAELRQTWYAAEKKPSPPRAEMQF